jgi:hypothetical protein
MRVREFVVDYNEPFARNFASELGTWVETGFYSHPVAMSGNFVVVINLV